MDSVKTRDEGLIAGKKSNIRLAMYAMDILRMNDDDDEKVETEVTTNMHRKKAILTNME